MGNLVNSIGMAYRPYGDTPFGMHLRDRLLHTYVIGQTGTGKSTLLANLALQDAQAGHGLCLIDPHGDLAETVSQSIDVPHTYWCAADAASPYGYNPLTRVSAEMRPLVVSGLIETFKKQWADAWGARMEHLLRYALLALLELPKTDLRDVMRLFVCKDLRNHVIAHITDPVVRDFWTTEFAAMNYRTAADGVSPLANKLGAFIAHPVIRKAVCEPERPLRFRQIMDQGEIVIVNLAKGRLGADLANVLGGLIVASLAHAAFTRHDLPEAERRPFFLYVDEFHNFSTTIFANMLSEVRKYGLGVTLAQQYTSQAENDVFEAVMGNVGSVISFRVGALDAPKIAKQLHGIDPATLITQPNHRAALQIMIDGQKSTPFSATMHPPGFGKLQI